MMTNNIHWSDEIKEEMLIQLIDYFNIISFVETGADEGDTTIFFSKHVKNAYTCEIYKPRYNICIEKLKKYSNISISLLSSEKYLAQLKVDEPIMFYLDAHWYDYWPLKDELKVIQNRWNKSLIIIHDTFVPDNPYFMGTNNGGGDERPEYGGRKTKNNIPLDINYIKPLIPQNKQIIFPDYATKDDYYIGYCIINCFNKEIPKKTGFKQCK